MADLTIDYSLSLKEKMLFPIIPAYGLRHLKKVGWQNKLIGVIELFPVLGPIVALIEKIVISMRSRKNQASATNVEKNPQGANSNKEIRSKNLWKQEFKKNALENFKQRAERKKAEPFDLSLSPAQENILKDAIKDLDTQKFDRLTVHGDNGTWVFSIPEIPNIIFKCKQKYVDIGANFEKRIEDIQKAQEVIESENLDLLHAPAQKLIQIDLGDRKEEILLEQKLDILHGYSNQKSLFHSCLASSKLTPFIQECMRQMVVLILKTGFSDVRFDNNPLLTNGRGIGLVDFDTSNYTLSGLLTGKADTQDDGILNCMTFEMLESIEPLLKSTLPEKDFEELHMEQLKEKKKNEATERDRFSKYLQEHKIVKGNEPVKLDKRRFIPKIIKNGQDIFISELEKKVNAFMKQNTGLCLPAERHLYVRSSPNEKALDKLKQKNKIFDWVNLKNVNEHLYGFYLWC